MDERTEIFMWIAVFLVGLNLAVWMISRWWVGYSYRQRCERARRQAERDRATLESYRRNTVPGRRTASRTDTHAPSSWDVPAMSAIGKPEDPTGLEITVMGKDYKGAGGSFAGAGASGGWGDSGASHSGDSSPSTGTSD